MQWYLIKTHSAATVLRYRQRLYDAGIELFLPTESRTVDSHGTKKVVERPQLLNYICIHTDRTTMSNFVAKYKHELSEVWEAPRFGGLRHLVVISDSRMEMFMRTVALMQAGAPFVRPTEQMLEHGDRVRVLSGPFAGVEGILLSQQGRDGGQIIIRISNELAVSTCSLEPEVIEVLEFAPASHHIYQKLNSLEARLVAARSARQAGKPVPAELYRAFEIFVRRYRHLQVSSLNSRVRYLSLLLQTCILLNQHDESARVAHELESLLPNIRSTRSLELAHTSLGMLKT